MLNSHTHPDDSGAAFASLENLSGEAGGAAGLLPAVDVFLLLVVMMWGTQVTSPSAASSAPAVASALAPTVVEGATTGAAGSLQREDVLLIKVRATGQLSLGDAPHALTLPALVEAATAAASTASPEGTPRTCLLVLESAAVPAAALYPICHALAAAHVPCHLAPLTSSTAVTP
jgi:biopolymer transport protein ExbD